MNKSELVHRVEAYIPNGILKIYRSSKRYYFWKLQQIANKRAIKQIRAKNGPLNVVFIVNDSAIWKYDSTYRLMASDPAFSPLILVCPVVSFQTEQQAQDTLNRTYDYFVKRGYSVMKAAEKVSSPGISVASLQPDIVFYSYLWTNVLEAQYRAHNLPKYLKCYVDYGYCSIADEWGYSSAMHPCSRAGNWRTAQ